MARVARPRGRVLFSSLNLDGVSFDERPWRWPAGCAARGSATTSATQCGTPARWSGRSRTTGAPGQAEDGEGWGRRPLRAHEFRFVVHFATMEETVAEARAAGLEVVAAYADDGRELDPGAAHTDADYVHYVCRRSDPSDAAVGGCRHGRAAPRP